MQVGKRFTIHFKGTRHRIMLERNITAVNLSALVPIHFHSENLSILNGATMFRRKKHFVSTEP